MDQQLISIVIPTLNEAKFLPKLLRDLVVQLDKDFEVLVIDGHSTDQTFENAIVFKKNLHLSIHEVQKRNAAFQRNYGAQKATGKYVVFIDADTRLAKNFIKNLRADLKKNLHLILIPQYSSYEKFFQSNAVLSALNLLIEASQKTNKALAIAVCLIFERNYFLHLHGFDEKVVFAEDCEIVRKAKKAGVNARILNKTIAMLSLRRFQKEGIVTSLGKSLVGTIQGLGQDGLKKKLFEYEMGGNAYSEKELKQKSLEEEIRDYVKKLKQKMGTS